MTTITAKDVSELRKATGAGMMDCKEALKESGGDYQGALDFLRKKGQKVAAKRADREVNEGVVVTLEKDSKAIVLALSCETDFVAKNEDFIALAKDLAELGMENQPATKEDFLALSFDGSTVSDKLVDRTGTIGEKIEISEYHIIEGENISSYIHAGSKIGVVVAYKDGGKEGADQFFRSVAMHIAAMSPSIMHPSEFDADFVTKETEMIQAQIKAENDLNEAENLGKPIKTIPQFVSRTQITDEVMAKVEEDIKAELAAEGKPEKIWDKILPGKIDRFILDNTKLDQENCLLSQVFALDDKMTVEEAIKNFAEEAEVIVFKRVAVG
ncbi:MAG: translation elongation factor Ts [Planctomycetota bacterium]